MTKKFIIECFEKANIPKNDERYRCLFKLLADGAEAKKSKKQIAGYSAEDVEAIEKVLELDLLITHPESYKIIKQNHRHFEVGTMDDYFYGYEDIAKALRDFCK